MEGKAQEFLGREHSLLRCLFALRKVFAGKGSRASVHRLICGFSFHLVCYEAHFCEKITSLRAARVQPM